MILQGPKYKTADYIFIGIAAAIIIGFLLLILPSCQEYSHTEYYPELMPDGTQKVKSVTKQNGVPDWSEGKQLNINAVKP